MNRSPLPCRRKKARAYKTPRCKTLRCSKPAKVAEMCVQHAERRADELFSLWVRARDAGRCTAIGVLPGDCSAGLHAAHIVGRRNHTLRFEPKNVHALCPSHHYTVDQHGQEGAKHVWAVALLGEDAYDQMMFESLTFTDRNVSIGAALGWLTEGTAA